MKFLDYIRGLLPVFEKNDLLEGCEVQRSIVTKNTIPAYSVASQLWNGKKLLSEELKDYTAYFSKNSNAGKSVNIIDAIFTSFQNSVKVFDALSDKSKTVFSDREANVSMTYLKVTIMRLLDAMRFATDYASRFLNYIYMMETEAICANKEVAAEMTGYMEPLPPAEIQYLKDNFPDFCLCIRVMNLPTETIIKHLDSLPDATITELTDKTLTHTVGTGKLDPMNLEHLSVKVNIFYHLAVNRAERQAIEYKKAKSELELLQLRNLQMKKILDKEYDAKLEKEIAYQQNRVTGLIYDIEQMEKKYGR